MTFDEDCRIRISAEQAHEIAALIASGACASEAEILAAGLHALRGRSDALGTWLREAVIPVAAAMEADRSRAIPAETVFAELRARHAGRSDAA